MVLLVIREELEKLQVDTGSSPTFMIVHHYETSP